MMATTKFIRVGIETAAGLKPEGKHMEFANECAMLDHIKVTWPKCQYVIYYPDKSDERYYGDVVVKVFHPHIWSMVPVHKMGRFINIMTGYDFDQVGTHMIFSMRPSNPKEQSVTVGSGQIKELKENHFDVESFAPHRFSVKVCDD